MHAREKLLPLAGLILAGLSATPVWGAPATPGGRPPNVLMIPVDDLRPQLGCYGHRGIVSPNIDRLAAAGRRFHRAYTMVSTCSPSRTCLMTGCRPDTTRIYDLNTHFRTTIPDVVTLTQHFQKHGYETVGMGKVFHGSLNDMPSWNRWVEPEWSGSAWLDPETEALRRKLQEEAAAKGLKGKARQTYARGTVTECMDVDDNAYLDGAMTDTAVAELKRLAASGKPFFLAVGYHKPHLPFIAPKRYWDLYPEAAISLTDNPLHPKDMPPGAVDTFPGELGAYSDVKALVQRQRAEGRTPAPDEALARRLIHGYSACISYIDAQIGRLLQALDETGLADNTVVCLWGDHGWHLGENGTWGKHTNLEWGTHSPLIIRVPGQPRPGVATDAIAEFVDVYPTLAEACGLPLPDHCEGRSLMPLIRNPDEPRESAAISQFRKTIHGVACMGYTVRTDQWRYTEWRKRADLNEIVARELYDHRTSHNETENVVNDPAHAPLLERLARLLKEPAKTAIGAEPQ
ncbi:MAG: sulfatase [Lentisphaeria bacterium]|nr:sulfatase [Lentisphaeria bacterium]